MIPDLAYVLPIRRQSGEPPPQELTAYLRWVASKSVLVVVDGSDDATFELDRMAWGEFARHVGPDPSLQVLNGKAWGVLTGIPLVDREIVIIADDDVRYDECSLVEIRRAMDFADLVRPQNVFRPLPWHAAWDTGRTLLNRTFGVDHPGTLAVRRSMFLAIGGYDGDVLFENLELVRTFRAAGARIADRPDLYVARVPPTVERFWSQRLRQAYDDLAEPGRLIRHLAVVPTILGLRRRPASLTAAAAIIIGLAEVGRRRAGGTSAFPARTSFFGVPWLLERGVCSWLAMADRAFRGGCGYAGARISRAASSPTRIRRGLLTRADEGRATRVRAIAERGEPRPPTAAEADGRSINGDWVAGLIQDGDVPPHEQGTVWIDADRPSHFTRSRR